MCDKVVCERWCGTKLYKAAADEEEEAEEAEGRDTESNTRTPHKDVGNNPTMWGPLVISWFTSPNS